MAEEQSLYGTWKIVECVSLAGTVESTGIEGASILTLGTLFTLDESGDVTWKVNDDAEPMPFFSCETYEHSVCGSQGGLTLIGTYDGHIIEFTVEVSDDLMLLTYERCCMLQCQKVSSNDSREEGPYSLLQALEQGYFSDLTLTAASGKQFKVHRTVLSLAVPELNWKTSPPPLTGLPEDVLSTMLHYMYGQCLPRGLSEDTARLCIQSADKLRGFQRFSQLCQTFLKSTALKNQMTSLVEEMHACADRIIDLFSGRVSASGEPVTTLTSEEALVANPAKLCYVFKQALREAAVAGSKLLILCDLFSRRKNGLSREERHNIIKYAKSRFPVFMKQLIRLLEVCKSHTSSLTDAQRHELAAYLIPEIEQMMDTQCMFTVELQTALEHVITLSSGDKSDKSERSHSKKGPVADVLGKSLRNALHLRELMKLKAFHEKMTQSYQNFLQKKQSFSEMTQEEKVRSVVKNMEQLLDEIPSWLGRIEDLMTAFDKQLTWREFKYLFKLGTSKVAWVVNKLQSHQSTVTPLIHKACDMVHRDQFGQSLTALGLLPSALAQSAGQTEGAAAQASAAASVKSSQPPTQYAQLSAVESLCQPPYPWDSQLAASALQLFRSQQHTDMVFEVITVQETGDVVIDHSHTDSPITRVDRRPEVDIFEVRAHCVIVASQCDWARRALLSGMQESIHKKIPVHDTNAEIFKLFLEYLYSGRLEMSELSTEQLSDLLVLADRYEMDALKSQCEYSLRHLIDEDSVLFLLSLADQYHTTELKKSVLSYISEHPAVTESDVFAELPDFLQAQVENLVAWPSLEPRMQAMSLHRHTETPSSASSSDVDLLQMNASSSSSTDDLEYMEDSARLEACVTMLRDVVGGDMPYAELRRVALAADCDSNRALNYIFSGMS